MKIIAFDGHDGAGKTGIAKDVVSRLENSVYVKPYDGLLGDYIAWLYRIKSWSLLNETSQHAVQFALSSLNKEAYEYAIFDRGWLSIFTILPKEFWVSWEFRPYTVLFWCSPTTVVKRLKERNEDEGVFANHEYFCNLYRSISEEMKLPIINTSIDSYETCVSNALSLVKNHA